jgi:hypothetical protein
MRNKCGLIMVYRRGKVQRTTRIVSVGLGEYMEFKVGDTVVDIKELVVAEVWERPDGSMAYVYYLKKNGRSIVVEPGQFLFKNTEDREKFLASGK